LGFDRCDAAVVTNLGIGDHLGLNHIHTVEQLAKVKRVVVENVAQTGFAVLNAADPLVAKMADVCPGGVIFFSVDPNNLVLATHKAQGRRVVYRDGDAIVVAEGKAQQRFPLSQIPLTHNGQILFQVENAMAAIAAVWGLNVPWDVVSEGLSSFVSDAQTAPGRFNLFEYRGATLIADYGHNPDAIAALVNSINTMPAKKRVAVISGAGDRRDADITEQTKILSSSFDHVILYEDQCQRGRSEGEVVALLRAGLKGATRTRSVHEVKGEFNAIDLALKHLEPGDLCLVLIDQVDEALEYIARQCK
jgi:cyanophycin synthetase